MGWLAALAVRRVHVLVLEAPGRPMLRLRAEAAVRARGWIVAAGPADADLLLVCGDPAGRFATVVDGLWAQLPTPRARRIARSADELPTVLDAARQELAASAAAPHRPARVPSAPVPPSLVPLTDQHVELGPGEPWWPAGLVVTGQVRDGRLAAVRVRVLAAAKSDPDRAVPEVRGVAIACAEAARFLRVAGWPLPAAAFDRIVQRVLAGRPIALQRRPIRAAAALARRSASLDVVLRRAIPGVALRPRLLALLAAAESGRPAVSVVAAPARLAVRLDGQRPASVPLLVAAGWDDDD